MKLKIKSTLISSKIFAFAIKIQDVIIDSFIIQN